jgi:hypothetical protein
VDPSDVREATDPRELWSKAFGVVACSSCDVEVLAIEEKDGQRGPSKALERFIGSMGSTSDPQTATLDLRCDRRQAGSGVMAFLRDSPSPLGVFAGLQPVLKLSEEQLQGLLIELCLGESKVKFYYVFLNDSPGFLCVRPWLRGFVHFQ